MNEADRLEELIRQAHEASRDLRAQTMEATAAARRDARAEARAAVEEVVREFSKDLRNQMEEAMRVNVARIHRRFDALMNALLNESNRHPSMEDIIHANNTLTRIGHSIAKNRGGR